MSGPQKWTFQASETPFCAISPSINDCLDAIVDIDFTSHAAVMLGRALFPFFALALDLPENFFDNKVNLTPIHYFFPFADPPRRNILQL
jgi:hypothetical protein